jgi:hypothetical protein
MDNDLYTLLVGFTILIGISYAFIYILNLINQNVISHYTIIMHICKWTTIVVKVTLLSIIWFILIPFLIGSIVELVLFIPIMTPFNESSSIPIVQSWAMGLLFLKMWLRYDYIDI